VGALTGKRKRPCTADEADPLTGKCPFQSDNQFKREKRRMGFHLNSVGKKNLPACGESLASTALGAKGKWKKELT